MSTRESTPSTMENVRADARPATTSRAPQSKPKILICDDDALIRQIIVDRLSDEFECRTASSAEEAFMAALGAAPDLIISDLVMPGMDGLALCRELRKLESFATVPVMLLTGAQTDDELRAAVFDAGADNYLVKPIGTKELLARVRSLVRLRRSRQQLERRTAELEIANETLRGAQGALVQTEKLATLGTLVAGIAHELNNPLSYMKSGAAQLGELAAEIDQGLDRLAPAVNVKLLPSIGSVHEVVGEVRGIASEISEGAERLARIAADLKSFSATAPAGIEPIDLAVEVRRAWSMAILQAVYKPRLVLADGAWPRITAPGHHIGQVLLNLFVNAVHALAEKGAQGEVSVWLTEEPDQVSLHVKDNGKGIAPEHLPRIFDPFFTTKPPPQGTGLGLSVSFGLIRSMGGLIEAHAEPGEGAHFIVHLPKEPMTDDYNATRLGRPPSRSILQFVSRPPTVPVPVVAKRIG